MTRHHLCHFRAQSLAALLLLLVALPLSAQVRTLGLREMVGSAGMIFVGTVSDTHGGYDEHGDIVTYTTFTIEQPISGVSGSTVTVKQLGGEAGGLTTRLEHVRYFHRGERVLVMFYPVSEIGFTSPVGLSQGVWTLTRDNQIIGMTSAAVQGLESLLKKYGIAQTGSIDRAKFIALINDLLAAGKSQMKGGNKR